ncbi:NUDIX domain-containing protein [candidate division GN15 bacterium]|nr:NUDIX domain-containing protein [candidate division GN15 bacterium]
MQTPALTVDIIIRYPNDEIVLIRRANDPFKNQWAIPGGFVDIGETVEQAAVREAKEETGLEVQLDRLVGVYSDPNRDPRGHTVSVVFLARPTGGTLQADTDAADTRRTADWRSLELAFDHAKILADALG